MSQYWFAYATATGAIPNGYAIQSDATSNPWPGLGAEYATVSYDAQTASADVVMANAHPDRYLMQGSPVVPVLQPYVVATYSGGTLTVTVNQPPATPPTSATLTVGSTTETIALTSNTGTLTLAVHASLAGYSLPAQVTATGCVAWSGDVGTPGQGAPVKLQIYTPSGGSATVAPVGPGSKAFLRSWAMGLTEETQVAILTEALQDLMTAAAPVAHIIVTKIVPAMQAANLFTGDYALTAQDLTSIATWQSDFAPVLTALSETTDASGNPTVQLGEAIAAAPGFATSAQVYATAVGAGGIPGVE